MEKLLVMTDLHICSAGDTIIGLDPVDRFCNGLSHALKAHPDAAALILMGDLTHQGTPDQYIRLHDILRDLPLPVIPMLGNHDRRDAFLSVFPDAPLSNGFVQTVVDLPHHRIITLDTLDGPPYLPGHHSGRLCETRTEWLRTALDGAGNRTPLVFAHHPPFETGIIGMDLIRLKNGDALRDLLAAHPGVMLFCGHVHRTISGVTKGVPWMIFKSPCHQGVIDLENPDSSLSVDEPAAYGLLLLSPDNVVAHTQDVGISGDAIRDDGSVTAGAKNPPIA